MLKQLELRFKVDRSPPPRKLLVRLSELDRQYRERCVNEDLEFPDSMLLDTRCQRMGVSRSCFASMQKWDQNLMLADEQCIMRYLDWEYEACCRIDWARHEQTAKAKAEVWAQDFADFRKSKQLVAETAKPRRSKRNG